MNAKSSEASGAPGKLSEIRFRELPLGSGWSSLVAAGVLAVLVIGYSILFLSAPLANDDSPRSLIYLRILIPEIFWQGWTAEGKMPFSVIDRIPIVIAAVSWIVFAGVIGDSFLRLIFRPTCLSGPTAKPLAIAVGLSVLSLITLVIGCCGLLHSYALLIVVVTLGGFGLAHQALRRLVLPAQVQPVERLVSSGNVQGDDDASLRRDFYFDSLQRRLVQVAKCVIVPLVLLYVAAGCMPPIEFDVREYHLQAPKEFWEQGRISFLPHNIYGNMPLGAEMHALAWMSLVGGPDAWWWGALVGKLVISLSGPITAWLIGAHAAQYFGRWAGWISASVFLGLPGVFEVATFGLIDTFVGLYLFATLVVLHQITANVILGSPSEQAEAGAQERSGLPRIGDWLTVGFVAGSAVACKYPAILFVVMPMLLVTLVIGWLAGRNWKQMLLAWLIIAMGGTIACGPWLVKNAVLTGNPVYPFLYSVFGGETLDSAKQEQWRAAHAVPTQVDPKSGVATRYSVNQATDSLRTLFYRSPVHNLTLVPLAIVGCIAWLSLVAVKRPVGEKKLSDLADRRAAFWNLGTSIGWCIVVALSWWVATHRLDRFWLPVLPVVAWIAAAGVSLAINWGKGIPLSAALVLGWTYSLLYLLMPPASDFRYAVSLDALRNDVCGEKPGRISEWFGWLNKHLTANDRVLLVGDAAVFDLTVPHRYSTCFDDSLWEQAIELQEPEKIVAFFQERGITHLCINWSEINRYRSPGNYGFRSEITTEQVQQLVSQSVLEPIDWQTAGKESNSSGRNTTVETVATSGVELYRVRGSGSN